MREYVGRLEEETIARFEEKMKKIHQNAITLLSSLFKSAMTIK
jgi:hypothetical protein